MNDRYGKFLSYQTETHDFGYFRKHDQSPQWSYYSTPKILSRNTSLFIPINTTSRNKEGRRTRKEKQES